MRALLIALCIVLAGCYQPPPEEDPEPTPLPETGENETTENHTVNETCRNPVVNPNGSTNPSLDADRDGISDSNEGVYWTDPCHWDSDGDSWSDFYEVFVVFTNATSNDTDNDTLLDPEDPAPVDSTHDDDGDGVWDQFDIYWPEDLWVNVRFQWTANNSSTLWWFDIEDERYLIPGGSTYGNSSDWESSPWWNQTVWNWDDNSSTVEVEMTFHELGTNYTARLTIDSDYRTSHWFREHGVDFYVEFALTL